MDNEEKCLYCNNSPNANLPFGEDNLLQIREYSTRYVLKHDTGWYDEFDSFDIESEIDFCPKCGRKLKGVKL